MVRAWVIGILALVAMADSADAGDAYYIFIFGSQTCRLQPKYTHTWAAVVHATWDATAPSRYSLELHTNSWEPATLNVRVWAPHPEPGVNLDLDATFRLVLSEGQRVAVWGPFQCSRQLYQHSLIQLGRLERHEVLYKAIDFEAGKEVADCIHAISDIDPRFGRAQYPLVRVGHSAARYIAEQFVIRGVYDQNLVHAEWLIPALGLNRYPIEVHSPQELIAQMGGPDAIHRTPEVYPGQ